MSLVPIQDVNQITTSRYGFSTYDWDNNRGGFNSALVAKVSFRPQDKISIPDAEQNQNNLKNKTAGEIARIFNEIFLSHQAVTIKDRIFQAQSLHLRVSSGDTIPDEPFIFVIGKVIGTVEKQKETEKPQAKDTTPSSSANVYLSSNANDPHVYLSDPKQSPSEDNNEEMEFIKAIFMGLSQHTSVYARGFDSKKQQ